MLVFDGKCLVVTATTEAIPLCVAIAQFRNAINHRNFSFRCWNAMTTFRDFAIGQFACLVREEELDVFQRVILCLRQH